MGNLVTDATRRFARLVWHPNPVPSRPATFAGVATLTTSRPDLRGPYTRPVSADLLLDARGGVRVRALYVGAITLGSVTCTITQLTGTGIGTYVAGELHLDLGLHVGIDALKGAEDSDLHLSLTTDSPGCPAAADGCLTLVGTSTFTNGYLGGRLATMVVTGTISLVDDDTTRHGGD